MNRSESRVWGRRNVMIYPFHDCNGDLSIVQCDVLDCDDIFISLSFSTNYMCLSISTMSVVPATYRIHRIPNKSCVCTHLQTKSHRSLTLKYFALSSTICINPSTSYYRSSVFCSSTQNTHRLSGQV